eukprot:scaffold4412_cov71-Phaeocystis_antarctica.AAC.5
MLSYWTCQSGAPAVRVQPLGPTVESCAFGFAAQLRLLERSIENCAARRLIESCLVAEKGAARIDAQHVGAARLSLLERLRLLHLTAHRSEQLRLLHWLALSPIGTTCRGRTRSTGWSRTTCLKRNSAARTASQAAPRAGQAADRSSRRRSHPGKPRPRSHRESTSGCRARLPGGQPGRACRHEHD